MLTNSPIDRISGVSWLRWLLLLGVIAACYAPGLHGSFVFDDDVNILQNQNLRISSLQWAELWTASLSGDAGPLGRPVALLSFALNLFFGGADPYYFKLVNLLIHLGNTLLVGLLAQSLCAAFQRKGAPRKLEHATSGWSGWLTAALWGLHPINLTGVLYIVQRMTSLSALFGFCALLIYSRYREGTSESANFRRPGLLAVVVGFGVMILLLLSALAKESGLLFAPLLLWIEYLAFGFRLNGKVLRVLGIELRHIVTALVGLACTYALLFKIPTMLAPAAFASRDFDVRERGITEARVVFYYLRLILFPRISELSLYHDDFPISRSIWDPITTILSIGGLLVISLATILLRKRFPALLFAWGWFLIAHSLESTVFPLELVHEHRNYFATVGLCMIFPIALMSVDGDKLKRLLVGLLVGYLVLIGFITHIRALQWANIVDWAALEASNHPLSARANYELARNYMVLRQTTGNDQFGELADKALVRATESYRPGILPYMARIHLAYFRNMEPDPQMVEKAKFGLRNWPFSIVNTATLNSFVSCQVEQNCRLPDEQALEILRAALENPIIPKNDASEVKKLTAQYYINRYNDLDKGIDLIVQALKLSDRASTRIMYAQALALQGKFQEALGQLDTAELRDKDVLLHRQIELERQNIREAAQRR